jgi:hypothetical protein
MKATLFLMLVGILFCNSCLEVGYQPSYIISQEEQNEQTPVEESKEIR